ncbi:phage tail spike protein [Bacillus pseudomycoides]|uniref:phage tail spike protein n=1 Tax=Bacillus pseudomycoides TaxID=64104 RepID=UPI002E1E5422|nr:phage tail spike protein [Bacillus pseudomycoides]
MKNTLHILDFKTEATVGIIEEEDYRNDIRKWDLENALDTFEFEVGEDIRDAFTLMSRNIIAKRVREGGYVTYFITEIDQGSDDRSKKIVALSEHVKLKGAKVILPQKLEQYTVAQLIDFCVKGTKWKRGVTEFASFRTINIDKPTNPLALLQRLKSEFGMELRFRTVIKGNQIVARYVDAVKKVGRDSGKEITLGKDLIGINRIENSQNIVTALVPVLDRGEDGILTIETVNDGKNFIYDFNAFKRWHQDGHHIFDIYTPETEEQDMKPERLKQLGEMELKKRINTSQIYKADAQSLEKIFGLSHEAVRRGDTVRIKDTEFSPPLYLEARAIGAEECDTDPSQDKYYFGDYREIVIVSDELQKWYKKILGMLETKANKPLLDKLEELVKENDKKTDAAQKESEAAKQLAEQVVENLKNYQTTIYEGVTAPTEGLTAGKSLWQDISQGKPGILKKWNGTEWEVLLKDYGQDVKELDERTAEVTSDVKGLTSKVEQVSITTTEQGKQILDANTKIEQNSQAISAKVDIKQVENYVGGIGRINEIRNTRFTQGTKYWGYWTADNSPMVIDKDTTYLGDFSCKLSCYAQTSLVYSSFTSTRIPVQPGEDIVISAYFMTKNIDEHYNKKIRMVPIFWKSDGTQLKAVVNDFTIPNDMWVRQSYTIKTPAEAALVGLRAYVLQNGTFWMAHPMLQKAAKESSFIENPNDMVDKDKIMDDLADKVATEDYNQKITQIDNRFTVNEKGLDLRVLKTDVYSKTESDGTFAKDTYVKSMEGRLQVTEKEITSTVKKGYVISEINQTAESIKIQAEKIDLVGKVNAEWIKAGLLSGLQVRTSNTNNYVSLDNQFIRLYESGVVRLYVGYHRRSDGDVQPTIILGGDNTLSGVLGTLQVTQMRAGFSDASTNIGLVDEVINGVTYKSAFLEMQRSGVSVLHANDFHVLYSGNGKWYFRRGKSSSYSSSLTIADNGSDTDLVMPNVTMRNSRVTGYTGVVQFLTPNIVGDGWGGVQAHIIAPSLREYKSNIRDVPFSALEKVRNAKIREFNYKGDTNLLYEMRENKDPNDPPLTTKDIKQYYGLIVDESDEVFVDKDKTGTHLYSMTSLTMKSVQELEEKHDQEITVLKEKLEAKDIEIATMKSQIASLQTLVQSLIDKGNQTEMEQQ